MVVLSTSMPATFVCGGGFAANAAGAAAVAPRSNASDTAVSTGRRTGFRIAGGLHGWCGVDAGAGHGGAVRIKPPASSPSRTASVLQRSTAQRYTSCTFATSNDLVRPVYGTRTSPKAVRASRCRPELPAIDHHA